VSRENLDIDVDASDRYTRWTTRSIRWRSMPFRRRSSRRRSTCAP